MNDSNNYASQISGWVNQSILPQQQMGGNYSGQNLSIAKNSNQSLQHNHPRAGPDSSANSTQHMNHNVAQLYKHYATRQSGQKSTKARTSNQHMPHHRAISQLDSHQL